MARKISTSRSAASGVVKDGIYQLVVVDAEEKVSSSGNDMVKLTLAILRGGRPAGRTLLDHLVFSEEAQWKFDNLHDALEIEEGKEIDYRYYKGKKVYASLITDEYNGMVNNKVKTYLPADIALSLLEKQQVAEVDDDEEEEEGFVAPTPKQDTRKPAATAATNVPARRGRPSRPVVAEMEDDDEGMPL